MKSLIPLCLLLAAGRLLAADAPAVAEAMSASELMALMEFVGDWEHSEGEWIDAMSLESQNSEQADSGEDHEE